jgi:hypothetical protein
MRDRVSQLVDNQGAIPAYLSSGCCCKVYALPDELKIAKQHEVSMKVIDTKLVEINGQTIEVKIYAVKQDKSYSVKSTCKANRRDRGSQICFQKSPNKKERKRLRLQGIILSNVSKFE